MADLAADIDCDIMTDMSKTEKLKKRIKERQSIWYDEAETFLLSLGFKLRSKGSHHVFFQDGYP